MLCSPTHLAWVLAHVLCGWRSDACPKADVLFCGRCRACASCATRWWLSTWLTCARRAARPPTSVPSPVPAFKPCADSSHTGDAPSASHLPQHFSSNPQNCSASFAWCVARFQVFGDSSPPLCPLTAIGDASRVVWSSAPDANVDASPGRCWRPLGAVESTLKYRLLNKDVPGNGDIVQSLLDKHGFASQCVLHLSNGLHVSTLSIGILSPHYLHDVSATAYGVAPLWLPELCFRACLHLLIPLNVRPVFELF